MKATLICRFLFLIALSSATAWIVAEPSACAMPCCSDLNCEGDYYECVAECSGNQTCMNNCLTAARSCARTLCSDCSHSSPCWFYADEDCGLPGWNESCMESAGCAFPYICYAGRCTQIGCFYDSDCQPGYHCSGGFCLPN